MLSFINSTKSISNLQVKVFLEQLPKDELKKYKDDNLIWEAMLTVIYVINSSIAKFPLNPNITPLKSLRDLIQELHDKPQKALSQTENMLKQMNLQLSNLDSKSTEQVLQKNLTKSMTFLIRVLIFRFNKFSKLKALILPRNIINILVDENNKISLIYRQIFEKVADPFEKSHSLAIKIASNLNEVCLTLEEVTLKINYYKLHFNDSLIQLKNLYRLMKQDDNDFNLKFLEMYPDDKSLAKLMLALNLSEPEKLQWQTAFANKQTKASLLSMLPYMGGQTFKSLANKTALKHKLDAISISLYKNLFNNSPILDNLSPFEILDLNLNINHIQHIQLNLKHDISSLQLRAPVIAPLRLKTLSTY